MNNIVSSAATTATVKVRIQVENDESSKTIFDEFMITAPTPALRTGNAVVELTQLILDHLLIEVLP